MRGVKIVQTGEEIKSQSGIFPAGRLLRKFGFEGLDSLDSPPQRMPDIRPAAYSFPTPGLICLGQGDFCDMNKFRRDRIFKHEPGVDKIPI